MRVLFLTHRLPYAPNRGDRIRAYHALRVLAAHAEVDLFSLVHDDDEASRVADLRDVAARVTVARAPRLCNLARGLVALAGDRPLTHALLDAPAARGALEGIARERRPDAVLAYCSGMARFALERPLDTIPFVLDMVDVDSEKWAALARSGQGPKRWVFRREARVLARFESRAARAAFATTVVNERERAALARIEPEADVHVVPNGVDVEALRPPGAPAEAPVAVFCGVLDYAPNVDAALRLGGEVWPRVRARRPDARLLLVGSSPARAVRELATRDRSIEVTGAVPDVRPYLWRSAIAVVPLAVARGVQNKVLEAIAAGLPAVMTRVVADGLPGEAAPACRVADTADEIAAAVLDLLARSGPERRAIAARADLSALGWEGRLRPLADLLAAAARREPLAVARHRAAPAPALPSEGTA